MKLIRRGKCWPRETIIPCWAVTLALQRPWDVAPWEKGLYWTYAAFLIFLSHSFALFNIRFLIFISNVSFLICHAIFFPLFFLFIFPRLPSRSIFFFSSPFLFYPSFPFDDIVSLSFLCFIASSLLHYSLLYIYSILYFYPHFFLLRLCVLPSRVCSVDILLCILTRGTTGVYAKVNAVKQ